MFTGLSFVRSTTPDLPKGSWMSLSFLEIDCNYPMGLNMRASLIQEKLELKRKEVLARLKPRNLKGSSDFMSNQLSVSDPAPKDSFRQTSFLAQRELRDSQSVVSTRQTSTTWDPFNKEYFPLESMNRKVELVRGN